MVKMSVLARKKRYKFKVVLRVEELSSVPFVNGVLFAKVRLLNGGNFTSVSEQKSIENNKVRWDSEFQFEAKMTSNVSTAVLDPTLLRISIRKETKGGKSYLKVGYATINLAQFAAAASGLPRRYLLEGYNQKNRQDNSMLLVNVTMTLIMGDVCFRLPTDSDGKGLPLEHDADASSSPEAEHEDDDGPPGVTVVAGNGAASLLTTLPATAAAPPPTVAVPPLFDTADDVDALSDSSGRGSGQHHTRHVSDGADFSSSPGLLSENGSGNYDSLGPGQRGHARALSSVSAVSSGMGTGPASGTGFRTHSRQSSLESCQFHRNPSSSSGLNNLSSLDRKPKKSGESNSIKEDRMLSTRPNNDELVSKLLSNTTPEQGPNPQGNLHLTLAKDGTCSVVSGGPPIDR